MLKKITLNPKTTNCWVSLYSIKYNKVINLFVYVVKKIWALKMCQTLTADWEAHSIQRHIERLINNYIISWSYTKEASTVSETRMRNWLYLKIHVPVLSTKSRWTMFWILIFIWWIRLGDLVHWGEKTKKDDIKYPGNFILLK